MQEHNNQINIDEFLDEKSRNMHFTNDELSLLFDLTYHEGYKVFNKLLNKLMLQAIDTVLGSNNDNILINKGRANAFRELKREFDLKVKQYSKKLSNSRKG